LANRYDIDRHLARRLATDVAAAPDGRVAFTLQTADREESRWLAQLWLAAPGRAPQQLTRGTGRPAAPAWSPDGAWLAFLSDRPVELAKNGGVPKRQVWLLPAGSGEAFALTKAEEGVRSFAWASDSKAVYFVADEPRGAAEKARLEREKKRKEDAVVVHGDRRPRALWSAAVPEPGEEPAGQAERLYGGDLGLAEIAVSPDGTRIAFTTNRTGLPEDWRKYELLLLRIAGREVTPLVRGRGWLYGPRWAGDALLFFAPQDASRFFSQSDLWLLSAAGGEPVNLTSSESLDAEAVHPARSGRLIVRTCQGFHVPLSERDRSGQWRRLTGDRVTCLASALDPTGRYLAYVAAGPSDPGDLWLLDLEGGGDPERLTDLNPGLRELEWGAQEVVRWESDGWEIEGVLLLPPGYTGGRLPLIVLVHGGPHGVSLDAMAHRTKLHLYAAAGYAVLAPNFRGSRGRGSAFAVANVRDLGGGDFRDILRGVDHLIDRGIADPARLGIVGGSYGGYMANWAVANSDRFAAAVSMYGIFHLLTDYSQSLTIPNWEKDYLDAYYWEEPDLYRRLSPGTNVASIRTPVLIMHGDVDDNTGLANSQEMYQALRHLGQTVEFVRFPREGHGFQEPNHQADEVRRTIAWFDLYLKKSDAAGPAREALWQGHRVTLQGVSWAEERLLITLLAEPKEKWKLDLNGVWLVRPPEGGMPGRDIPPAGLRFGPLFVTASAVELTSPAEVTVAFEAPPGRWELRVGEFAPLLVED
jgi:dipeptidyl aminopeptidase/acylaminoacyl peptidase